MKDLKELANPFDPNDVEWFVGVTTKDKTKGMAIPFITNRAVQARLDDVCGIDGWKNEYKPLKASGTFDENGIQTGEKTSYLCGISVWSEARGEWITKWDGSEETAVEALKGGLSSAMKRAAVNLGIGRYLYLLESPWVEIEPQGRSYVIKANQKIVLPEWAMPGGRGFPMSGEPRRPQVQIIGQQPQPQQTQGAPQQTQQTGTQKPSGNQGTTVSQLSDRQIDRAYKKALAAGYNMDDVKRWIESKFGISDIKKLNRQQYDALCDALDAAKR